MTTLPSAMRHVAMREPGPPDVLALADGPAPQPAAGDLLIRALVPGTYLVPALFFNPPSSPARPARNRRTRHR